jgi:hypothetical protein
MALIGTIPATANVAAAAITGTLANARLPAGTVLQTITQANNTITSTTSDSYQNLWSDISITMTGNNKLLVMAFFTGVKFGSSDARITFKLFVDGSASTELARDAGLTLTDVRFTQAVATLTSTFTAGTTKTINVKYASVISGDTVTVNSPFSGSGSSTIIVQEIAQ